MTEDRDMHRAAVVVTTLNRLAALRQELELLAVQLRMIEGYATDLGPDLCPTYFGTHADNVVALMDDVLEAIRDVAVRLPVMELHAGQPNSAGAHEK